MRQLIAFDLDDTLAVTKQPITDRMATLLAELTKWYEICVITGGKYEQLQNNLVNKLPVECWHQLHIMSQNGGHYYHYDSTTKQWEQRVLVEDMSVDEQRRIEETLESAAKQLGYWEENPAGDIIENRGTQLTYSGLGQLAKPEAKYSWDPDYSKRQQIHRLVQDKLSEYEVKINGNTSVDVTRRGHDKGFGIQQLSDITGIALTDMLFYGDQLQETGNDYPIKVLGVESVAVSSWEETAVAIEELIAEQKGNSHGRN